MTILNIPLPSLILCGLMVLFTGLYILVLEPRARAREAVRRREALAAAVAAWREGNAEACHEHVRRAKVGRNDLVIAIVVDLASERAKRKDVRPCD